MRSFSRARNLYTAGKFGRPSLSTIRNSSATSRALMREMTPLAFSVAMRFVVGVDRGVPGDEVFDVGVGLELLGQEGADAVGRRGPSVALAVHQAKQRFAFEAADLSDGHFFKCPIVSQAHEGEQVALAFTERSCPFSDRAACCKVRHR